MQSSQKEKFKILGTQLKSFLPGTSILIAYLLIVWILNQFFHLYGIVNYIYIYLGFFGGIMFFSTIKKKGLSWKKVFEITKSLLFGIIFIFCLMKFYSFSGGYGVFGIVLAIICYAIFVLFGSKARRKRYFETLDTVEKMLYGKPLKEFKKKPKLRIKWK